MGNAGCDSVRAVVLLPRVFLSKGSGWVGRGPPRDGLAQVAVRAALGPRGSPRSQRLGRRPHPSHPLTLHSARNHLARHQRSKRCLEPALRLPDPDRAGAARPVPRTCDRGTRRVCPFPQRAHGLPRPYTGAPAHTYTPAHCVRPHIHPRTCTHMHTHSRECTRMHTPHSCTHTPTRTHTSDFICNSSQRPLLHQTCDLLTLSSNWL